MSAKEKVSVIVVGGGTAGWMTAAALARLLPTRCSVHLVESEAIGIVGVGEATLPHIRGFNDRLGISEADFMSRTHATFKLGIEFRNWGALGDSYIHPFGTFGTGQGQLDFHHYWLRLKALGAPVAEFESFSLGCMTARLNRFAMPSGDPRRIESTYGYAYQFDATLFAPFLRSTAEGLGARRTEGRITAVHRDSESGDISSVQLESGELIEGDLFIDCSGFVSLLLGRTLGEPFQNWSRWLPCDRAVAMPCRTETALTPYTSAIAMDSGWRWRIPLQHRTGNGYVYASSFVDDQVAADALVSSVEGEPLAQPRVLKFVAGRRERSWVHNCVGIGLASGFLEPLESTSIYLIQQAITALLEFFPGKTVSPLERDEFNRLVDLEYDKVRDFLILHYHATRRADTDFWNHTRTMEIPDSLAEKIELFQRRGRVEKHREGAFLDASWIAVYFGQGIIPQAYDPRADTPPADALFRGMANLHSEVRAAAERMPSHATQIQKYCPMGKAA